MTYRHDSMNRIWFLGSELKAWFLESEPKTRLYPPTFCYQAHYVLRSDLLPPNVLSIERADLRTSQRKQTTYIKDVAAGFPQS